jgi:CRP-like cAMP-binding protein
METGIVSMYGAAFLAFVAQSSLLFGVVIGLYVRPSWRANAIIMAFGTGALIQALALDLAFETAESLVHETHITGLKAWAWVAIGFLGGGLLYNAGNRRLEQYGASLRHPALTKAYLQKKKQKKAEKLLGRLAKVDMLRSLPPEEMDGVLVCVEQVRIPEGDIVFRKGDEGSALFLIDEGAVEILDGINTGHVLAKLGPGQPFGETALLTGEPRTATVRAATDLVLLKIEREHFHELLDSSARLRQAVEALNTQRILQNVDAKEDEQTVSEWKQRALRNVDRINRREQEALMAAHGGGGSPLALFLGAALDGIPAAIVIGSAFVSFETFSYTFLVAIFLSSVPEAIGSTLGMQQNGFSTRKIFVLWSSLVLATVVCGALGNVLLAEGSPFILAMVRALAGGGILAMVASVMLPEAFESGGPTIGIATIFGFLTAFLFVFL